MDVGVINGFGGGGGAAGEASGVVSGAGEVVAGCVVVIEAGVVIRPAAARLSAGYRPALSGRKQFFI